MEEFRDGGVLEGVLPKNLGVPTRARGTQGVRLGRLSLHEGWSHQGLGRRVRDHG
jgi:hypothetical protein